MFILPISLLFASVLPSGDRLKEDSACYTTVRIAEGQAPSPIFNVLQTIKFTKHEGKPAVEVVVHQRRLDGKISLRDHFLLDATSLRPFEFRSERNGVEVAKLSYSDTRILGTKVSHEGKQETVDLALSRPVWEGNLWGITFGAVPHQLGENYVIPFYQHDKGLGEFKFKVIGNEVVQTPDGKVDAWVLDLALDNNRKMQYLVSRADGRELGLRGSGYAQFLGGDCSALK